MREKVGEVERHLTFGGYADRATRLAAGLRTLGVGPGDRVVMLIGNRPEFHVADMATLLLGATPISIYNSSSPDQIRYLAGHAQATVAIVEHREFLDRLLQVRAELPAIRHVVAIEPLDEPGVESWDELLAAAPLDLETAAATAQPDDLATDHLHVGHHRTAEGRDARPPQHLLDGRQPPRRARLRARPVADRVVPPDGAHRGTRRHALRRDRVRVRGHHLPRHPSPRSDARRDPAADPLRGAAHVREDPQHGAGGARRRRRPGRDVRGRARDRCAGRRAPRPRRGGLGRARDRVRTGRRRVAPTARGSCSGSTSCESR